MKTGLFDFQEKALKGLHNKINAARMLLQHSDDSQIITFSAPTGSGKTIMMTALFEDVFFGDETNLGDKDAIIVWLSDSPELNEQTCRKIIEKSDKIPVSCLVKIDSYFVASQLTGGHIYFLNTQKLGSDKLLTTKSDTRSYTIWETLTNTIERNGEHLLFVIDEAHRGTSIANSVQKAKEANSIMQKFLFGSESDGLKRMPLTIGMTATAKRFKDLAENVPGKTLHEVDVPVQDVKESGLLKDTILIDFPKEGTDAYMTQMKAAIADWMKKCERWETYCTSAKIPPVKPLLVIQVEDKKGGMFSETDLAECLRMIEDMTSKQLYDGEVVHTFNGEGTIRINGLNVRYAEPSSIQSDEVIKVVFFKMNLSTGWDCPRAETMMSFRSAKDMTYISQLLGRIIRTPLACRIALDEELNNVRLFLPQFDEKSVNEVIKRFNEGDGAATSVKKSGEVVSLRRNPEFEDVFANMKNLSTYYINKVAKQPYRILALRLASLITLIDGIDLKALPCTKDSIVGKMGELLDELKAKGDYDRIRENIIGLKTSTAVFKYGDKVATFNENSGNLTVTDYDLRNNFERAGKWFGKEGLHRYYRNKHKNNQKLTEIWIDVIVLLNSETAKQKLESYCEKLFESLYEKNLAEISLLHDIRRADYDRLFASASKPVATKWEASKEIDFPVMNTDVVYEKHLYVDDNGTFKTTLNTWEREVLEEEMKKDGFVAWLRNIDRKKWAIGIPYHMNNDYHNMYPDLLIMRRQNGKYVFDLLEPHDPSRIDNFPKAKGLASFAETHWNEYGEISLIRKINGSYKHLNLSNPLIRGKVQQATTDEQITALFD